MALAEPLPTVTLMQPTLVAHPVHRDGWIYEEKYDGWRMVAYKARDQVRLVSHPGRDHTRHFPDLVASGPPVRHADLGRRGLPLRPAANLTVRP